MISIKKVLLKIIEEFQPKPVLLWENPNPASEFLSSTINENSGGWVTGKILNDYQKVKIVFDYGTLTLFINNDGTVMKHNYDNTHQDYIVFRDCKFRSSGIEIQYSYGRGIGSSTAVLNTNNIMIPLKIYGIK